MSLVGELKRLEGFDGNPYHDHLGYLTIGYGTRLPLDNEEAELLLKHRVAKLKIELHKKLDYLHVCQEAWDILDNMAYQMGVAGVLKFKNMIAALQAKNYDKAADEMLDSKWAKIQTPNRAKLLSDRMRLLGI